MKKEWQKPVLEVLDISRTMQGSDVGNPDGPSNWDKDHHSLGGIQL